MALAVVGPEKCTTPAAFDRVRMEVWARKGLVEPDVLARSRVTCMENLDTACA